MKWAIYVAKKSEQNFRIALDSLTWGNSSDCYSDMKKGDSVLLGFHAPDGRKKPWREPISELHLVELTDDPFFDDRELWPDKSYPYRFNFKVVHESKNIDIGSDLLPITHEVALHNSLCRQSKPAKIHEALVLTENPKSKWDDKTGVHYHYPNKYVNKIKKGVPFIYYRGGSSNPPEYFGVGRIGEIRKDHSAESSSQQQWYCSIDDFKEFPQQVGIRDSEEVYFEDVQRENHWRDGVRVISPRRFNRVLESVGIDSLLIKEQEAVETVDLKLSDILTPGKKRTPGKASSTSNSGRKSTGARSKEIGKWGEIFVIKHLESSLPPDQAKTIDWHDDRGDKPGWDISYSDMGRIIRIEVKSTVAKSMKSFEISANEWEAARKHRGDYFIYLVTGVDTQLPPSPVESINTRCFPLKDPYTKFEKGELSADSSQYEIRNVSEGIGK